jgi:hypothetical protein
MKTWRDRLAVGVASASAIYIVGLVLAKLPARVELQLVFDEQALRATATVEGLASVLRERVIWAHQENLTARHLISRPDTGTRCEESLVFASNGESVHLELLLEQEEADRLVRGAYFDPESGSCIVPLSYLGMPREDDGLPPR